MWKLELLANTSGAEKDVRLSQTGPLAGASRDVSCWSFARGVLGVDWYFLHMALTVFFCSWIVDIFLVGKMGFLLRTGRDSVSWVGTQNQPTQAPGCCT